jgi:hypothetical protein
MKRKHRIPLLLSLAPAAVPLLAYGALALAVGRDRVWETAFGPPDRQAIEFRGLAFGEDARPNRFLMCPPDLCAGPVDAESPTFAISAPELQAAWDRMVGRRTDTIRLAADGALLQAEYETRTPLLRFPDTVTVRFIPLPGGGSTLAVLSRSHYGHGDLGTNGRRMRAWIDDLRREAGA